jgi:hypothetical protein
MKLVANRAGTADGIADPLEQFKSELTPGRLSATLKSIPRFVWSGGFVVLLVGMAAGWSAARFPQRQSAGRIPASVVIETPSPGADVLIGGKSQGRTPLTLQLSPGEQSLEVVQGAAHAELRVTAVAGAVATHHVVFAPAPRSSTLAVTTEPVHLPVQIDGVDRGVSPLTVADLSSGPHRVRVSSDGRWIERTIDAPSGASLVMAISARGPGEPTPAASVGGWLAVRSAIPLQLLEDGQLRGSSEGRVMLPVGSHSLEAVNADLGFREQRTVKILPGKASDWRVRIPKTSLSVNAVPWADVTVDAEHVGETPIGNYAVTIGQHEIIFRHPEFGERRQTILVGLKSPARVTMNFQSK